MKAAVCYEYGKPLVIEDVELDPPKDNEVKVRIAATAVCHSDIHAIKGEIGPPLPFIAGHESSGYVEEIGKNVVDLKPGDHVTVSFLTSCGQCYSCKKGLPHLCATRFDQDKISPIKDKSGKRITRMVRTASFAEYVNVDQSQAVRLPKEMPLIPASLLACGVVTGFGAVVNTAKVQPRSSVVVVGVGGVGLNSVQAAALSGAYPVIAVDISDKKLEAARIFGATHTINSKKEDMAKVVLELTSGRGADYVFVAFGRTDVINQSFLLSGIRGMTVILGLPPVANSNLSISVFDIIGNERILTAAHGGSTNMSIEIPQLVALYQAGKLKLDELISGKYPLNKINEAIELAIKGDALRNIIVF
jgi:S-(hydroxymethyl)glutathione dehydrogenase / alcohol dehydrogenase